MPARLTHIENYKSAPAFQLSSITRGENDDYERNEEFGKKICPGVHRSLPIVSQEIQLNLVCKLINSCAYFVIIQIKKRDVTDA